MNKPKRIIFASLAALAVPIIICLFFICFVYYPKWLVISMATFISICVVSFLMHIAFTTVYSKTDDDDTNLTVSDCKRATMQLMEEDK